MSDRLFRWDDTRGHRARDRRISPSSHYNQSAESAPHTMFGGATCQTYIQIALESHLRSISFSSSKLVSRYIFNTSPVGLLQFLWEEEGGGEEASDPSYSLWDL